MHDVAASSSTISHKVLGSVQFEDIALFWLEEYAGSKTFVVRSGRLSGLQSDQRHTVYNKHIGHSPDPVLQGSLYVVDILVHKVNYDTVSRLHSSTPQANMDNFCTLTEHTVTSLREYESITMGSSSSPSEYR